MTLDKLKVGQKAVIKNISEKCAIRRRLIDLGLINGTTVECVMISPLGEPKAYLIKGCITALRYEDTSCINIVAE